MNELISAGKLPIVSWRKLSEREHLRYYMLTKLFGMALDSEKFRARFGSGYQWEIVSGTCFFPTVRAGEG